MNIEFNTKSKTVTIIEMEAKDLPRILQFIEQVCGNIDNWKIVSKITFIPTTSPTSSSLRDVYFKDRLIGEQNKYNITCDTSKNLDTLTSLATEKYEN